MNTEQRLRAELAAFAGQWLTIDPPSREYRRYVEVCRRLGVSPKLGERRRLPLVVGQDEKR